MTNSKKQIVSVITKLTQKIYDFTGRKEVRISHIIFTFYLFISFVLVPFLLGYEFHFVGMEAFSRDLLVSILGVIATSSAAIVPFVLLNKQNYYNKNLQLYSLRTELLKKIATEKNYSNVDCHKYVDLILDVELLFSQELFNLYTKVNDYYESLLSAESDYRLWKSALEKGCPIELDELLTKECNIEEIDDTASQFYIEEKKSFEELLKKLQYENAGELSIQVDRDSFESLDYFEINERLNKYSRLYTDNKCSFLKQCRIFIRKGISLEDDIANSV